MLAFHGFFRIGEITVRAGVPIENVIHRNDIRIVPGHVGKNKPSLRLTIRHAKHQQVNRPVMLEITSQSTNCTWPLQTSGYLDLVQRLEFGVDHLQKNAVYQIE